SLVPGSLFIETSLSSSERLCSLVNKLRALGTFTSPSDIESSDGGGGVTVGPRPGGPVGCGGEGLVWRFRSHGLTPETDLTTVLVSDQFQLMLLLHSLP